MKVIKFNPEVFFTSEAITKVNKQDLGFLKKRALDNKRRRARLCAHKDLQESVQEMLIVHRKGAYIRPHKHIDKSESLHVIKGRASAIMFDEDGNISEVIPMGDYASGLTFYYRITEPIYHTLIITSDFLVFHEAVKGPFDNSKNIFAPWSPAEGDHKNINKFMRDLKESKALRK